MDEYNSDDFFTLEFAYDNEADAWFDDNENELTSAEIDEILGLEDTADKGTADMFGEDGNEEEGKGKRGKKKPKKGTTNGIKRGIRRIMKG